MNYQQPVYTLRLTSKHCGYSITVNGCVIDDDISGQATSMEYPINHYLKNGDNKFDIYHRNIANGKGGISMRTDSTLCLELYVREHGTNEKSLVAKTIYDAAQISIIECVIDYDDKEQLANALAQSTSPQCFNIIDGKKVASEDGAYTVGDYTVINGVTHAMHINQTISLPAPFPLWRFFQADELTFHQDLTDQEWIDTRIDMAQNVYQPLYQALLNDDTAALTALFTERGKELDLAFYNKEGQDVFEMVRHLRGIINDPDFQEVREVKFEACDVAVSFNNKMTWLHNWDLTMSHKATFKHITEDLVKSIPVMFARFDGQWEIVR